MCGKSVSMFSSTEPYYVSHFLLYCATASFAITFMVLRNEWFVNFKAGSYFANFARGCIPQGQIAPGVPPASYMRVAPGQRAEKQC